MKVVTDQNGNVLVSNNKAVQIQESGGNPNAVLYVSQSLTDAQKLQARTNIGATTVEVFWATYGTSTSSDIDAAVTAGKLVICRYNNNDYLLAHYNSTDEYIYFGNVYATNASWIRIKRSDNSWLSGLQALEVTSNKVTSISNQSTDLQYPSAKLLYDSLAEKQDIIDAQHKLSYDLLSDVPTIPEAQVNSDWNADSGVAKILNKPNLATVATSGSYNDLSNKPTIPNAQIQSDWNQSDNTKLDYIKNKPTIPAGSSASNTTPKMDGVATVGSEIAFARGDHIHPSDTSKQNVIDANNKLDYSYLTNTPTIPSAPGTLDTNNADAQNTSSSEALSGTVKLHKVSKTGSYNDLLNKPTIPAAQVNTDWDATSGVAQILNKPTLATVATSGLYGDLSGTPTIPTKTSDLTNDGADNTSTYVEADDLATVATTGSYNDLTNKPTIPAAQINSDWNASSGVGQILNKPTLATVATSGDYDDLINKPTIPAGVIVDQIYDDTSQNAQSGIAISGALADKQNVINANNKLSYNYLSDTPTIPTVPTISTSIITDASSDVMTASPKAVKTYVDEQFTELTSEIINILWG